MRDGRLRLLFVGRLKGSQGAVWQLTAIDCYSSYAWAELVVCAKHNPSASQTSKLARRVARELKQAGWRLERVLCDKGNEYRGEPFRQTIAALRYLYPRYTGLRRELNRYLSDYNTDRVTTAASPTAASPPTSSTVPTRWEAR